MRGARISGVKREREREMSGARMSGARSELSKNKRSGENERREKGNEDGRAESAGERKAQVDAVANGG